jgi:hypothetical protein
MFKVNSPYFFIFATALLLLAKPIVNVLPNEYDELIVVTLYFHLLSLYPINTTGNP